jgi:hypothetical protein
MKSQTRIAILSALLLATALAGAILAESAFGVGGVAPLWSVVGSRGNASSSGSYELGSTTGQSVIGQSDGQNNGVCSGYWCAVECFEDDDGADKATELSLGTNYCRYDTDRDGCADGEEPIILNTNQVLGGRRNPLSFWDFMDVPSGDARLKDRVVSGGDIAAIVVRFGSNDATPGDFDRNSDPLSLPNLPIVPSGARQNYHPAYDRGGSIVGQDPWDLLPPDGAIAGGDIAAAVLQFGHTCAGPP